jgi:DNA-binding NarL/FixJ family response regulator
MFWRRIADDELQHFVTVSATAMGASLIGMDRALAAWRSLLGSASFFCLGVEAVILSGHPIVAFGSGVFVSEAFADAETARPAPGLIARLIAQIDAGSPVVLTHDQIRDGNTRGGLSLAFSNVLWRSALAPDQAMLVEMQLSTGCLQLLDGYRLRRVFREAVDVGVAVPDKRTISASIGMFRDPVLGLSERNQELLSRALETCSDDELGRRLGVTTAAVKKRWSSIFHHVGKLRPDLVLIDEDRHTRGPQKRHRLLAYIRQHQEELRPYGVECRGARQARFSAVSRNVTTSVS